MNMKAQTDIDPTITAPNPSGSRVEQILKECHLKLQDLVRDQAEISARIKVIKKTLAGMATIFGKDILDRSLAESIECLCAPPVCANRIRLTQACRLLLRQAAKPLTLREISRGIVDPQVSVLTQRWVRGAPVKAVLNRLELYGKVSVVITNGCRKWKWVDLDEEDTRPSCDQDPRPVTSVEAQ
jgi:hypothetical protein